MTIALFAFTGAGRVIADRLEKLLTREGCDIYCPDAALKLADAAAQAFVNADALVFIGAAGIAVRAVAPLLQSKTSDPAVAVIDEKARWVIPLVSGHIGGANELTERLARLLDAEPVITTATDSNGIFAVDVWAVKNGLLIDSMEKAKLFSAALLRGETLPVQTRYTLNGAMPNQLQLAPSSRGAAFGLNISVFSQNAKDSWLHIIPKTVYLGIGCRKAVPKETIAATVSAALEAAGIDRRAIAGVGTIELKRREAGLLAFCEDQGWPLAVYAARELAELSGDFSPSEFVQSVTGVDCVCERAAVAASGGSLILKKYRKQGVTVAAAEKPFILIFESEMKSKSDNAAFPANPPIAHGGDIYRWRGVLDFSANISPLGLPAGVLRATRRTLRSGACYPDPQCRELRVALAARHGIDAARIVCGNGAADLIYRIASALRPRTALIAIPAFGEYEKALLQAGASVRQYALAPPCFELDRRILDMLTPGTDIVILCNPNNPTGRLAPPELLREIARLCDKRGIMLVVDECFNDFVDAPGANTLTGILDGFSHLIILKAFTKFYAMAGFRLGYCLCASAETAALVAASGQAWPVSTIAIHAGLAALQEYAYGTRLRHLIQTERAKLKTALRELGLEVVDGEANFLLFRLTAQSGFNPATFFSLMLAEGILLRPCAGFSGLDDRYYRAAVRSRKENGRLLRALRRIRGENTGNAAPRIEQDILNAAFSF